MQIPEGMHRIKISLPGYEEWDKKVLVSEGMKIRATLVEKKSSKKWNEYNKG